MSEWIEILNIDLVTNRGAWEKLFQKWDRSCLLEQRQRQYGKVIDGFIGMQCSPELWLIGSKWYLITRSAPLTAICRQITIVIIFKINKQWFYNNNNNKKRTHHSRRLELFQ